MMLFPENYCFHSNKSNYHSHPESFDLVRNLQQNYQQLHLLSLSHIYHQNHLDMPQRDSSS